jgi:hypothetical protein
VTTTTYRFSPRQRRACLYWGLGAAGPLLTLAGIGLDQGISRAGGSVVFGSLGLFVALFYLATALGRTEVS